jgi:hypothetical protein
MAESKVLISRMLQLLSRLAKKETVLWGMCFFVAASVYLGCPWGSAKNEWDKGQSEPVAAPYGPLVAVAGWPGLTSNGSDRAAPASGLQRATFEVSRIIS